MKRKVIGKGLGALFADISPSLDDSSTIAEIPISRIVPNRFQPRKNFSEHSLEELASSIRESGILQPVIVRRSGRRYELIAGERRFQAARLAGLESIPVLIRDIDDSQSLLVALVENLQREDLNPLEEAEALDRLAKDFKYTHKDISQKIGKSRTHVTNLLRVLRLPGAIRSFLREGKLSLGHAKVLLSVSNAAEQARIAALIIDKGLTVRDAERLTSQTIENRKEKNSVSSVQNLRDHYLRQVQENLNAVLSAPVKIKSRSQKGKGRIEIDFLDAEDLKRILKLMLGRRAN